MRYTKTDVEKMFARLCKALNRKVDYMEKGSWLLDYAACYGGYTIVENMGDSSVDHPFGALRRDTREMYLSMLMATQTAEDIKHANKTID